MAYPVVVGFLLGMILGMNIYGVLLAVLLLPGPLLVLGAQVVLHVWYRVFMKSDGIAAARIARVQLRETAAWFRVWTWHGSWWIETAKHPVTVLAVHGYTQNPTNWTGLRRLLADEGHACEAVFLGFAWPWRRIEGYGQPLERRLDQVAAQGRQVHIVVHSMGGLVLREVLERRKDLRAVVDRVVTLGTPHAGTASARVPLIHPAPQLRYGSSWVTALPALTALLPAERITTMGSTADLIVYPASTTRQPGATHVEFDHVGHAGLLVDPIVLRCARDVLTAPASCSSRG